MSVKSLAEAVILQSIEDLWCHARNGECIKFFKGKGYDVFSRLAGMNLKESRYLLRLVDKVVTRKSKQQGKTKA